MADEVLARRGEVTGGVDLSPYPLKCGRGSSSSQCPLQHPPSPCHLWGSECISERHSGEFPSGQGAGSPDPDSERSLRAGSGWRWRGAVGCLCPILENFLGLPCSLKSWSWPPLRILAVTTPAWPSPQAQAAWIFSFLCFWFVMVKPRLRAERGEC